jgi:endonuclease III
MIIKVGGVMITAISSDLSSSVSPQIIDQQVQTIDSLVEVLKQEDSESTSKKTSDLLIEYILANMSGDSARAQEILDQISALIKNYSGDMQNADGLKEKLQLIENTPGDLTVDELEKLQALAGVLQKAAASGDTTILHSPFSNL